MLVLAIALLLVPPHADAGYSRRGGQSARSGAGLWQHRHFTGGRRPVLYVAAVGVGAFFINYATEHWHGVTNQHASYLLLSIYVISHGRSFFSTPLMGRAGGTPLMVYSLVNIVLWQSGDDGIDGVSVVALIAVFFLCRLCSRPFSRWALKIWAAIPNAPARL